MIRKKYSAYLTMKKRSFHPNSAVVKVVLDASFFLLILLLLKVDETYSESANDSLQNTYNFVSFILNETTFEFSLLENSPDVTQPFPTLEEHAAEETEFTTIDPASLIANRTDSFVWSRNSRSLILLQENIFNSDVHDDREFSQIESILDMVDSIESFTGNQAKRDKCGLNPNKQFHSENLMVLENNKNFASPDIAKLEISGESDEKSRVTEKEKIDETSSSVIHPLINSDDDFCNANDSWITRGNEKGTDFDETIIDEDEFKKAEKMTRCISKDFNKGGVVCVCNATYCDKLLPIRRLPPGKYSWYISSRDSGTFRRLDGQLSRYTNRVKDAFNLNTTWKSQQFIGFGGGFSDSASSNILSLSQPTRDQLLRSYYGPFGLEYVLGRVPIGGTDFSPRFYTCMDIPHKFVLSEQDFKYKIPVIRKAMELTNNKLKLIACSYTAPKWMKTQCTHYNGELKREYYQLYADYHLMFLENYAKNGIKFWSLSPGNQPMIPFNHTEVPYINAMEWSPYAHSKWVNRHLAPKLKELAFDYIELVIGDDTREIISYYVKWFFEPLIGEKDYNLTTAIVNSAYFDVSGIAVQGYSDNFENEIFLPRLHEMFPEKFILMSENACYGKPQLGSWNCAERYAVQMLNYIEGWTSGFIDVNLVLDLEGGPNYLHSFLDAAIIVDLDKDEFYKQPVYYVMGHFSKFLAPDSVRVSLEPFNYTSKGVAAIAAQRPDNGIVIIAYNRSPQVQNATFVIDNEYTLSLNISANSINSVIFWKN